MVLCAICGEKIENPPAAPELAASREHVIPRSWYPDTTPQSVARWTVPSHSNCNGSLSADEEYVFQKFACVSDPNNPAASGIWDRAFRGLKPSAGKNEKDKNARAAAYKKLMGATVRPEEASPKVLSSAMRGLTNTAPAGLLVQIDPDKLDRVLVKIVRCISYKLNGTPPPSTAVVRHRMLGMEELAAEDHGSLNTGNYYWLGDGVIVRHGQLEERGLHAEMVCILLWEAMLIHAIIHWDMPGKFALADPLFLE